MKTIFCFMRYCSNLMMRDICLRCVDPNSHRFRAIIISVVVLISKYEILLRYLGAGM